MHRLTVFKNIIKKQQLVYIALFLFPLFLLILFLKQVSFIPESRWVYFIPVIFIFAVIAKWIYNYNKNLKFSALIHDFRNRKSQIQNIKKFFYNYPWSVEIYDKNGILIWANKYGIHFWKKLSNETINKFNIFNVEALQDSNFIDSLKKSYQGENLILNGSDYHSKIIHDNFLFRYYETSFSPVFSIFNEVLAVVVINREIVNEHIENKLKRMPTDGSEYKHSIQFLRNISHELRTPLNWIIGFSDLILKEKDILRIKEYNNNINRGGKLMLSSIEMLINMSLIVKNEISIKRSEFSVANVLYSTKSILEEEIKTLKANIVVKVSISLNDEEDDYIMVSDENKLRQIINYLVHNSLKFTTEGSIELGCRVLLEKVILFYIKDTGIGISKDIQEYIFDIFKKGNDGNEKSLSGQGLGLSIAKNYVKLLGGNIWFESEIKKGSTFFFTIKDYSTNEDIKPFFLSPTHITQENYPGFISTFRKRIFKNKMLTT